MRRGIDADGAAAGQARPGVEGDAGAGGLLYELERQVEQPRAKVDQRLVEEVAGDAVQPQQVGQAAVLGLRDQVDAGGVQTGVLPDGDADAAVGHDRRPEVVHVGSDDAAGAEDDVVATRRVQRVGQRGQRDAAGDADVVGKHFEQAAAGIDVGLELHGVHAGHAHQRRRAVFIAVDLQAVRQRGVEAPHGDQVAAGQALQQHAGDVAELTDRGIASDRDAHRGAAVAGARANLFDDGAVVVVGELRVQHAGRDDEAGCAGQQQARFQRFQPHRRDALGSIAAQSPGGQFAACALRLTDAG